MDDQTYYATIRFDKPDHSVTAEERGLFAPPAAKKVVNERLELHNFHTSPDVVKGPEGLDVQGFTYIQHRSALQNSNQWLTEKNIEDTYLPECEELICRLTGAKRAVANNAFFRRQKKDLMADPTFVHKRDSELDKAISQLPRDVNYVAGRDHEDSSLPPARMAHSDYSMKGLKDSVRYCREDIKKAGQEALDAEDANETPRRYAAFSVWRPIKPVQRDPIAACDWRTIDKETEIELMNYRAGSGITESGDYLMEGLLGIPPQHPVQQKWYWVPNQQPDEVTILKFADTAAGSNPDLAPACLHCSPIVEGTEENEHRASLDVRVFAFW